MTDGRDEREVHEALRLFRVVEAGDREAALGHPALRHHRLGARTEHHDEREAARLLEQAVLGPPREQHLGRLDAFRRGGVTVPHPQQRLGPLETLQPTLAVVRVPGEQSTHRAGYEDIAAARCGELADDRWSGVQRNEFDLLPIVVMCSPVARLAIGGRPCSPVDGWGHSPLAQWSLGAPA